MSKSKPKVPPFDPVDAAVKVRAGQLTYADMKPEEEAATRAELSHTGRLQTKLLRRGGPPSRKLPPATHFRRAIAG